METVLRKILLIQNQEISHIPRICLNHTFHSMKVGATVG